jgi:exodeoxyribonuclease V
MSKKVDLFGVVSRFQLQETEVDTVTGSLVFSDDQQKAVDSILKWLGDSNRSQVFVFAGVGGSGKSTVTGELGVLLRHKNVRFMSYTGKATQVLRRMLRSAQRRHQLSGELTADTIHSTIYTVDSESPNPEYVLRPKGSFDDVDLFVVDEGSMVGEALRQDILSFGIPTLIVGDHFQLPPVSDDEVESGWMSMPDVKLEQIHRQAAESPIIRFSERIRQRGVGAVIEAREFRVEGSMNSVVKNAVERWRSPFDGVILTHRNVTRNRLNTIYRGNYLKPYDPEKVVAEGDVVIVLRNHREAGLFNGMRGIVRRLGKASLAHQVADIDFVEDGVRLRDGYLLLSQFDNPRTYQSLDLIQVAAPLPKAKTWEDVGYLMDYGGVITVHKAQGSQFDEVVIIGDGAPHDPRWWYTAVTRAVTTLKIWL